MEEPKRITKFIIERPKLCLLSSFIIFLLFIPGLQYFQTDFGTKVWFRPDDSHIKVLESFEKKFGSDDTLVVALDFQEGIFTSKNLETLTNITESLWSLQNIARVDSLSNFHWSYADGDNIITEKFLPEDGDYDFPKIEQRALSHKVIPGYLISKDGQTAFIYARLLHIPNEDPPNVAIYESAEKIIKNYIKNNNPPQFQYHLTGGPAVNTIFQKTTFKDLVTITPILIIMVTFYLLFTFRSLVGMVVPLIIIGATLGVVFGIVGYLGLTFNSMTMIIPTIIIAIGLADSIHILGTFYRSYHLHADKKRAAIESLNKNKWPVFLTSFSTSIGFFSLIPSDIQPISDLGLLAGIGTMLAFFFTYGLVIPYLLVFKIRKPRHSLDEILLPKKLVRKYLAFLRDYRYLVLCSFMAISSLTIWLGLQNTINSNPFDYFKKGNVLYDTNQFVLKKLGGVGGPEIMINSGAIDGVKDPKFLKKVEQFHEWLEHHHYVNKVISIIPLLKEMNQSLHSGSKEFYTIPDNQKAIAEQLFLYELSTPEGIGLTFQKDLKNQFLRLKTLWSVQDSKTAMEKVDHFMAKANDLGLKILITGKGLLFQRMNSYIVDTFFSSITFALALITILLIGVFKSFKTGILSLIPNFIPICFGAGFLTLINVPIDVGCAIVASVTLGIAVDDTIHFLNHYTLLKQKSDDNFEIMVEVISGTGMALILTTIILVSGFGLFIFASLVPNQNFGMLCAIVLTVALICDLVALPTIIFIRDGIKKEKRTT